MRSEKEMFDLILGAAKKDERVRAVYMNGSRTNPNAPKDIFQDYDIVYVVTETGSFLQDENWMDCFGSLLMIQEPDKQDQACGIEMDLERSYGYLMLFTDGNRIDLRIQTKEAMLEEYVKDKLTIPLLDKDSCLPPIGSPTDRDYYVQKPTEPLFMSCCNNFWWCQQNVAKGLWRDELPYAKEMFECVIRRDLDKMVSWRVGIDYDFQVSVGKMGKYLKRYLPERYWEMYRATYSDGNADRMWDSILTAGELFRAIAQEVADYFQYTYPVRDDRNMTDYVKHVRAMSADAKEIY